MADLLLVLLSLFGLFGSAILCRAYYVTGRWAWVTVWALMSLAWAWIAAGELLWHVTGWTVFITRLPRALVFRVLAVAAIWVGVYTVRRR